MFSPVVVVSALSNLVKLINILILVRVVLTWVNLDPRNPFIQFIHSVTEPILAPIRNLIYNVFGYSGMLDFSPILALLIIDMIYRLIIRLLF